MKRTLGLLALSALLSAQSWAGTTVIDFNQDPSTTGTSTNLGTAVWFPSGGVGSATNFNDGYLQITGATSQRGVILFPDFDNGAVVQGFTFECDLRIGNGSADPADGFSINYARNGDPALAAGEGFASSPGCEGNLPEEGTTTGIAIGFDAWQSGSGTGCSTIGQDVIGVSVRIDGTLVSQFPCPVKNGDCANATSLQTGPRDSSNTPDNLCWAHLKVDLSTTGILNVYWKGTRILTDFPTTGYFPSPGRLIFAGRTGDAWQFQQVDNIKITTIPASLALLSAATGLPDGFSVTFTDAGTTSVLNPNSVSATLNGSPVAVQISKAGNVSTVIYRGFPTLLTPGSSNYLEIVAKDMNNNNVGGSRSFTAPTYSTVPAADAVAGVDTTKVGFRVLPWQSGNQPNRIYWTEEQLLGLYGENNADLSLATAGGYIPFTGLLNFNGDINGQVGSFQSAGGYADSPFPGIPGANGLTGSTAVEVLMFLKFPAAGIYTLAVNSDDGFKVTEGKNPKDRFANVLGIADYAKGSSDVPFTVAVMAAGIYPVRLIWENGNGELPDNGINMEFFSITNGVKTLINDPAPANTTGIVSYYAGPSFPAYVSHIYPPADLTGARADKLAAQITDGTTTLTAGSAKLYLDGALMSSSVTKVGAVSTISVNFTPQTLMAPGTRQAALVWSDSGGTLRSNTWSFAVANWVTLDASMSTPLSTADTTQPGFLLQVAQIDPDIARPGKSDGLPNQVDAYNALLGGLFFPWYATNTVFTGTFPPPLQSNIWAWEGPLDFNNSGSAGLFSYDSQFPGTPGVTARNDNFGVWIDGYLAFTNAGYYRLQISSDDGFRLSQGLGITRQVLHVTGSNVDRDVAAVVCSTNNESFGGSLPATPISGPVAYFQAGHPAMLSQAVNLAGKVAVMNNTDFYDVEYAYWAQTNGAIAAVVINDAQWGLPYVMGGTPPSRIHIPVLCVNGFGGEEQMWATNANLVATIGADAHLQLGVADYGKGMGWIDCAVYVPQPGLYPIHLTHWQGGGGAGFEWAAAYADTLGFDDVRRVLLQDPATAGSLNAYRSVNIPTLKLVKQGNASQIIFTGTLLSSPTVNGTYSPVGGATSPYTIPAGSPTTFYRSTF